MITRIFLSLALASAIADAQESTNLFDAPRRILSPDDVPIVELLDIDGDGHVEAIGARTDSVAGTIEIVLYENPGDGTFVPT